MANNNKTENKLEYQERDGDGRDGLEHGPLHDELRHRRRMPFFGHVATVMQLVRFVTHVGDAVTHTGGIDTRMSEIPAEVCAKQ